jgi:carbamoyl-phosphate synthase large subunit
MLGHNKVTDFTFNPQLKDTPLNNGFLFSKFHNVNKALGPVKSTGEHLVY